MFIKQFWGLASAFRKSFRDHVIYSSSTFFRNGWKPSGKRELGNN